MSTSRSASKSDTASAGPSSKRGIGKVYHEDVVRKLSGDQQESGVVVRCWYDEEESLPLPEGQELTGLDRALKKDEVGIAFYPSGNREILEESELEVVDRAFQVGDVCKRSLQSASSGVILEVSSELDLQHVLSKQRISTPVPASDVQNSLRIITGDHVIHKDWVGVVEEVFEEALVESSGSSDLVRVCDIGARLTVGEATENMLGGSGIWSTLFPRRTEVKSIVLNVKQTVVCVNWLGLNQRLTPEQQNDRPRPKRFWTDVDQLTLVRSFSEHIHAVGDKVIFRNADFAQKYGLEITQHGREKYPVDVMNITGTRTIVKVLWQDGRQTTELAKDLVPYLNLDEYDVWPGDFVVWKGEGQSRVAVVQSMDPDERTAEVLWYGTKDKEVVPVLELDVHGPDPVTFGVHRGDIVFISSSPTGLALPSLGRIGESEEFPEDTELRQIIGDLGMSYARQHPKESPLILPRAGREAPEIDWYGSVVDLHLDGTIEIALPCGRKVGESIDRLTLLVDGFDDQQWGDEEYDTEEEEEEGWMTEDGGEAGEKDDWEDLPDGEGDGSDMVDGLDEDGDVEMQSPNLDQAGTAQIASSKPDGIQPEPSAPESSAASSNPTRCPSPSHQALPNAPGANMPQDDSRWSRFEVLEEAPRDHAFINEPQTPPKKAFFSRLQKEFRVLQSSLPDSILVRSYEDRTDLLRVLIVGSENTPYEDAPFVIDFALKASYPYDPPLAHFHSWTNGNGRVSPNLYEEGKVCLSVLNTWSGERSESWNPNKSSLLQVFVSIQGLVLVREPWYTEPAYEKLQGTEEGRVNSRLYSEKAYVLSRGFVRRALEYPVSGLESELEFFYHGDGSAKYPGRLPRVLERANALITHSEQTRAGDKKDNAQEDSASTAQADESSGDASASGSGAAKKREEEVAVSRLSGGGVIVLKRTLAALEKLRAQRAAAPKAA